MAMTDYILRGTADIYDHRHDPANIVPDAGANSYLGIGLSVLILECPTWDGWCCLSSFLFCRFIATHQTAGTNLTVSVAVE